MASSSAWHQSVVASCVAKRGEQAVERLQRAFEADGPRFSASRSRRCGHQLADQVLRDQVHVKLIAYAVRGLAAEVIHLEHNCEAPQIEFRLPAPPIEDAGPARTLGYRGKMGRVALW